jgi:hypothetical protein
MRGRRAEGADTAGSGSQATLQRPAGRGMGCSETCMAARMAMRPVPSADGLGRQPLGCSRDRSLGDAAVVLGLGAAISTVAGALHQKERLALAPGNGVIGFALWGRRCARLHDAGAPEAPEGC